MRKYSSNQEKESLDTPGDDTVAFSSMRALIREEELLPNWLIDS